MKTTKIMLAFVILASVSILLPVSASVTIDWAVVGDPGNTGDAAIMVPDGTSGYGPVGYAYMIGKYEVTNFQYGEFLNKVAKSDPYSLYNPNMASYGIARNGSSGSYTYSVTTALGNRPVVYVSWFDAARFANWLINGQGSGDTESGAYTLNGAFNGVILKNSGAAIYIPSENEWYKAAYYNGSASSYSLYPNGQNFMTNSDANYTSSGSTDVGSYVDDPSFYGTCDQGGNVFEWNDAVIHDINRGLRGGSWSSSGVTILASTNRPSLGTGPQAEMNSLGFRLAAVPEPGALVLTVLFSAGLVCRRKR